MYRLQKEKNINVIYHAFIVVSLILAIAHLALSFFDVTLSIVFYGMANIPSVCYLIFQLASLYIPLLLMIPNGYRIPKALILKWVFYVISACYLLGNTWIFYFIFKNPISALFTSDAMTFQTFQREHALMFNYMIWNCYTPLNIVFSLINSGLFFICARTLQSRRYIFRIAIVLAFVLTIAVPFLFKLFGAASDKLGLVDNVYLIGSQMLSTAALYSLSLASRLWGQELWTIARRRFRR